MPEPDPPENEASPRTLDWLAGAAGLLGGTLLLVRRQQRASIEAERVDGEAMLDRTARHGRGRAGTPPSRHAREVGHEPQDADAGKVGLVMAGLAGFVVLSVFVLFFVLDLFHAQLGASRPVLTGEQASQIRPPPPLLEAHPEVDQHVEHTRETRQLAGYGWQNPAHTVAHIPIARAMALASGRPLEAPP